MKKILCTIFTIILFILILGATNSFASEISYAEAVKMLEKIPDEFNLNIKESEAIKYDEFGYEDIVVNEILQNKIKNIISTEDFGVYINIGTIAWNPGVETDIRKATVSIYTDETDEDKWCVEKEIKINYSNSSHWNEKDSKYVEEIASKTNFHRRWDYTIYEDGSSGDYQDKSDFLWNNVIGVDDIKAIGLDDGFGSAYFKFGCGCKILLFKNDVFYKVVSGSKMDTGKIIVPETVENTDEAYLKYARPILEKIINDEDEYELNGTKYQYSYTVKDIKRSYDDFIQFEITIEEEGYANGVLDYKDEFTETILIAKQNEYRGKLNPILQNVDLIEKDSKSYLKGQMNITEKIIGYNASISEKYLPKVILSGDNNKEYETLVTRGENDIYYFEIEINSLEIGKNYKIQVRNTVPDNKYPENNINSTLEENTSINISNEDIEIKSITTGKYVELSIKEKNKVAIGDISGDGKINTKDARLVLLGYVGKEELTEEQKIAADVNKDGKINTKDARQILLYYVGKISEFN